SATEGPAAKTSIGFAFEAVTPVLLVHALMPRRATATKASTRLVKLQHRHEGFLWNLHRADPLHPPLTFFLLFEQFALAGDVAAIALGQHVLAHGGYRLPRDHLSANSRLQRHLVKRSEERRVGKAATSRRARYHARM